MEKYKGPGFGMRAWDGEISDGEMNVKFHPVETAAAVGGATVLFIISSHNY
jgi:hypothetical protein